MQQSISTFPGIAAAVVVAIICCTTTMLHAGVPSFQGIGDLPGGPGGGFASQADGVSADGSVVVGWSSSASGTEAVVWTSDGGMVGLGDLPGGLFLSRADGVSADGSVVVGGASPFPSSEAFIWDATNGMRSLPDILVNDLGLDLTGWTVTTAEGVSADGLTIVGLGNGRNSTSEGWIATIPPQ